MLRKLEPTVAKRVVNCVAEVRGDPEAIAVMRKLGFLPAGDFNDEAIIAAMGDFGGFPELVPEPEILAAMTCRGEIPLDHLFVLDAMIHSWNAAQGKLWLRGIKDGSVAEASGIYLERLGQSFGRWTDVLAWAESHRWGRIEDLRAALKDRIAAVSR